MLNLQVVVFYCTANTCDFFLSVSSGYDASAAMATASSR